MPVPQRIRLFGMGAPIQIDLVKAWAVIVRNHHQEGLALNELI